MGTKTRGTKTRGIREGVSRARTTVGSAKKRVGQAGETRMLTMNRVNPTARTNLAAAEEGSEPGSGALAEEEGDSEALAEEEGDSEALEGKVKARAGWVPARVAMPTRAGTFRRTARTASKSRKGRTC